MFAFKFKAIDRQNHTIVDRVEASSIEDAYDRLAKRGFSDIRVMDSKKTAIDLNDVASRRRLVSSARQELELQKQSSLIIKLMMLYARDVKIWGVLLVCLVVSASLAGLHSAIVLVSAGLMLVHMLWFIWAMVPMILNKRALNAKLWRRWSELEQIMLFFSTWNSLFKTSIPDREIIFRLASAEAGQGRLEAALKRVAVLKNDSTLAPGFYEARLASVYFAAGDIQRVVETQKTALQLNPGIANTELPLKFSSPKVT